MGRRADSTHPQIVYFIYNPVSGGGEPQNLASLPKMFTLRYVIFDKKVDKSIDIAITFENTCPNLIRIVFSYIELYFRIAHVLLSGFIRTIVPK